MSNRRDFLKTAAFAALGSGMAINHVFAGGNDAPSLFNVNSRAGVTPKMKLRFFPYELKLRHVFTVATYSRTTTPRRSGQIKNMMALSVMVKPPCPRTCNTN